jgi:hypothetical protein
VAITVSAGRITGVCAFAEAGANAAGAATIAHIVAAIVKKGRRGIVDVPLRRRGATARHTSVSGSETVNYALMDKAFARLFLRR